MAQDWRVHALVYFCSAGSDLPWAVLNWRLDLEFTNMTEEDEEFQRLEREAKMRRMTEEDDDTQVYKKPWVGLTEEEVIEISHLALTRVQAVQMTQAKLREKNT